MSTEQPVPNPGPFTPPGAPTANLAGPPTPPGRNVLGLVALAVAIIGFVFAVWEGAYLIGWILLPIAFVLSLVALFSRGRSRKAAVAALIVSIIGTVAGGLAFTASAARAFNDAFGGGTVTAAPGGEPGSGTSTQGTREDPYPLGTTISSDDWQVRVNSFTPDATAAVLAANQFNDDPDAGTAFALANVTVTYLGADSGTAMEVGVSYVTSTGNVVTGSDKPVVAPDALGYGELYNGASLTGNVVLQIPTGDAGTLRVRPGLLANEVFFSLT